MRPPSAGATTSAGEQPAQHKKFKFKLGNRDQDVKELLSLGISADFNRGVPFPPSHRCHYPRAWDGKGQVFYRNGEAVCLELRKRDLRAMVENFHKKKKAYQDEAKEAKLAALAHGDLVSAETQTEQEDIALAYSKWVAEKDPAKTAESTAAATETIGVKAEIDSVGAVPATGVANVVETVTVETEAAAATTTAEPAERDESQEPRERQSESESTSDDSARSAHAADDRDDAESQSAAEDAHDHGSDSRSAITQRSHRSRADTHSSCSHQSRRRQRTLSRAASRSHGRKRRRTSQQAEKSRKRDTEEPPVVQQVKHVRQKKTCRKKPSPAKQSERVGRPRVALTPGPRHARNFRGPVEVRPGIVRS